MAGGREAPSPPESLEGPCQPRGAKPPLGVDPQSDSEEGSLFKVPGMLSLVMQRGALQIFHGFLINNIGSPPFHSAQGGWVLLFLL